MKTIDEKEEKDEEKGRKHKNQSNVHSSENDSCRF